MAYRWGNNGSSDRLYFLGFQNDYYGYCSHEIKRCLLLGRKAMTNLDNILKSSNITLPKKVHLVKAMVFPGVTYGCESCTIKKAEYQRTDAFELWCWRRYLRVPWTARRSNQSILKEISPEYHWLDGHEFEQASGVDEGQGSLAYCSPWGLKELDMTERLNWMNHNYHL